jgi:Cu-Zn family superoxide dismutase
MVMKKKQAPLVLVFCAVIAPLTSLAGAQDVSRARATLVTAAARNAGTIHFEETQNGVRVILNLSGLPPGIHGFHIHEKGSCDTPDFSGAGDHFNPRKKKHGFLDPKGPHAGDLPNIAVKEDGTVEDTIVTRLLTLKKGADNSLLVPGGKSAVIHKAADDYLTDPAGHSGGRIACGVIEPLVNGSSAQ